MFTVETLPEFLVNGQYNHKENNYREEKYFENDEENKKFISLSEKIGTKTIEEIIGNYFDIRDGYQEFIKFLSDRFIFSVERDFSCEVNAREILEELLEIKDRYAIVIKDDDQVIEGLEQKDIFILKKFDSSNFKSNTAFVFYFGPFDKKECRDYQDRGKLDFFQTIKKKISEKVVEIEKSCWGREEYYGYKGFKESFEMFISEEV